MNSFFKKNFVKIVCVGFGSFFLLVFLVGLYFFVYYNICPYIKNSMRGRHYYEKVLKDKYGIDFGIASISSPFDSFFDFDGSMGVDYKYTKKIKAYPLSNPSILFSASDDIQNNEFSDEFVKEYVSYNISLELEDLFLRFGINTYSRMVMHCSSNVFDNNYDVSFNEFYDNNECSGVSILLLVDKDSISNRKQIYDVINEFNRLKCLDKVKYYFYFVSDNYLEYRDMVRNRLMNFGSDEFEESVIYYDNGNIFDRLSDINFD